MPARQRSSRQPVCLIAGVGPGTGQALVERFFAAGYRIAMLARTRGFTASLEASVPEARGYVCDVTDPAAVSATVERVREELGEPAVYVHNVALGAFGDFLHIEPRDLGQCIDANTMGLLYLARELAPAMIEAGRGDIVVTSNTAAWRGKPDFAGIAPAKAAQRILAESMARTLWPKGVHVSLVAIDAVIDLDWTRKLLPDAPDESFCQPSDIAEQCFRMVGQPRSAWAFEVMVRPHVEPW